MKNKFLILALIALAFSACTDLSEEINDGILPDSSGGNVDVDGLLATAYRGLETFQTQDQIWALQQHSTDELMGPTRGTDWDDNGRWRVIHDHTWDAESFLIRNSFNAIYKAWYDANQVLAFNPSLQQAAEARFIRAFLSFQIIDNWGSLSVRKPGEDVAIELPTILTGGEAIDQYVINDLEEIMGDLPDSGPAYQATKNAARALLAKAYLNRAVYKDEDRLGMSFDAADMNKVIENCDAITGYSLTDNYYDNFRPDNDARSTELIFTSRSVGGDYGGNVRSRWFMTLHYNQNPSGWNGFCTIADFYDKFDDPNDTRLSETLPDLEGESGLKAGFLEGQQYAADGTALEDRRGNPLSFTKEVSYFETGDNLEVTGIRAIKYIPDYVSGDQSDNDYVLLRYADVLLMKAEAIARGGSSSDNAADIVNNIRTARGAAANSDGSLSSIYDERGFELWWEGWRRNDMIRFETFTTQTWTDKSNTESFHVLFPFPNTEIAANTLLKQNPGY